MKALQFSRKPAKYAAGLVAGSLRPGSGAKYGPISLRDIEPPAAPGPDWLRFRPRLAGICGSDLATIDGKSSRYFEPIVTFPFVPGHEVVGDLDDESRAVLIPVLSCVTRSIDPPCPGCAAGAINRCERIAFGHLEPGLQSGFCEDTGGGWSTSMVAHTSQLFPVADDMSDEAAVMIEPTACAVHAATRVDEDLVVVIGAGTLGLLTIAALDDTTEVIATARYPEQRRLAAELGATRVVEPGELDRAVRSRTGSLRFGTQLTGGAPLVIDCVGSQESLSQALRVVAPGGDGPRRRHACDHHTRSHRALAPRGRHPGVLRVRPDRLRPCRRPSSPTSTSAVSSRPRIPWPTTPTPSPTPLRPVPVVPSRSPSTSAPRKSVNDDRLPCTCVARTATRRLWKPGVVLMSRPGLVLDVDRSTPPILFHHGESFRLETAPGRPVRVIYPAEPSGIEDVDGAIRTRPRPPARRLSSAARSADVRHEADDRLRRHLACRCRRCASPTSASGSSKPCSTSPPRPASTTCTSSRRSRSTGA